jgi:hypothetical protein
MWSEIAPRWSELTRNSSFFVGREWVESWLQVFGPALRPQILAFSAGSEVVGACVLVSRSEIRSGLRLIRMYLNTGGEDQFDRSSVEFNTIPCRPGYERPVARALGAYLRTQAWDEIIANGFSGDASLEALRTEAFAGLASAQTVHPSPYVDLAALRRGGQVYEAALSRNRRWRIRKFFECYEALGPIGLEIAHDEETGLTFFEELVDLHQRSWRARGQPGAFRSSHKLDFHRTLIRRGHAGGSIQLLRVAAGDHVIGLLYNFVRTGKVYFYQSGFNYGPGLHPGYVTFVMAIRYCLQQGFDEFDFLAGRQQYKESLATNSRDLTWIVFRRSNLKMSTLAFLRRLKRRVHGGADDGPPISDGASLPAGPRELPLLLL